MTRRFIVDANLPLALARLIELQGFDCVHVADIGDVQRLDPEIWAIAESQSRTVVTRDSDFAALRAIRGFGPTIIWVRMGNVRKRVLLDRFTVELPRICSLLEAGEHLIELR